MLRIDWNVVFNIINILILFLLMKRFLFEPVNRILAKRQEEAEEQFAQADAQKAEAEKSRRQYDALLEDAGNEKERIIAKARQDAGVEYERIVGEAQAQAEGIVEKAQTDAEAEKTAVMRQADAAVKELVLTAAVKIAGKKDNAENDWALYEKFLDGYGE